MPKKTGTHGGARPGAGRPPKDKAPGTFAEGQPEPLEYLLAVMHDNQADPALRVRAAIAAAQYVHTKTGDGGKKEEKDREAKVASSGKFAPAGPPKLSVVNNR